MNPDLELLAKVVYEEWARVSPRERSYPNCHWVMTADMLDHVRALRDSWGNQLVLEPYDPSFPLMLLHHPVEVREGVDGIRLVPGTPR